MSLPSDAYFAINAHDFGGRNADNKWYFNYMGYQSTSWINFDESHIYSTIKGRLYDETTQTELIGTSSKNLYTDKTIYLSARINDDGTINHASNMKFYKFTCEENGVLYADLIPVRKTDNTSVGFYDIVRKKYYTNSLFSAGPDIN